MRKAKREIKDAAAVEAVLKKERVCRLGLCDGEWPYVVPVNYGFANGRLYFHSAVEGKKIDLLRRNDRVCFEVESETAVVADEKPCDYTTRYRSVIGWGRARFLETPEEKLRGLKILMKHHQGPTDNFRESVLDVTAVVEIEIMEMTGKASPAPKA